MSVLASELSLAPVPNLAEWAPQSEESALLARASTLSKLSETAIGLVERIKNAPRRLAAACLMGSVAVLGSGCTAVSQTPSGAYYWVGGEESALNEGASVAITQADPKVGPGGVHSLAELGVALDGNLQSSIEIGWTVDKDAHADDTNPRLFVLGRVGGRGCYNGCGFVPTSSTIRPGETLQPGVTGVFGIHYLSKHGGAWWVSYNGQDFGYFPESKWDGTFKNSTFVEAIGEVAEHTVGSCTPMGNGVRGTDSGAVAIGDFHLVHGNLPSALQPYSQDGLVPNSDVQGPGPYNPVPGVVLFGSKAPYNYLQDGGTIYFGGPGVCTQQSATPVGQ